MDGRIVAPWSHQPTAQPMNKPLVSRVSPLCSYCGARLPTELLFTKEEKARIEADELKTRNALDAAEADRTKKGEGAFVIPPPF